MEIYINLIKNNLSLQYIFDENDYDKEYFCSKLTKSKGFKHLHKCVMITKMYPEINKYIDLYLKENPEKINEKNAKGWTAIALASRNTSTFSDIITVKILLKYNANVNIPNNNNVSPLILSARYSNMDSSEETVKLLLENKANVNHKNNIGIDALIYACYNSRTTSSINTIKLLLEYGADVHQKINDEYLIDALYEEYYDGRITIDVLGILIYNGAILNKIQTDRTLRKNLKYLGYIKSKYEKFIDYINQPNFLIIESKCNLCLNNNIKVILDNYNKNIGCFKCYYENFLIN